MSKLLTEAFEKASQLPPEDQDELARWLLEELDDEARWVVARTRSQSWRKRLLSSTGGDVVNHWTPTPFDVTHDTRLSRRIVLVAVSPTFGSRLERPGERDVQF